MELPRVGIWTPAFHVLPAGEIAGLAGDLEEQGYGCVWIPDGMGRDPLVLAEVILAATERMIVATGIASIWGRSAQTMSQGQVTLLAAHPDRFLLGLGVSHQPMVEGVLKADYSRPFTRMSEYLDDLDASFVMVPGAPTGSPRVLAALGPRMLGLARDRAAGAHPYLVTPEHTATAREVLGPDAILAPEQAVVLNDDPEVARTWARAHLEIYLGLPNYHRNWFRLGFDESDIEGGGSDRLVDALVARGDVESVTARVQEHLDAGADHVAVQVLGPDLSAVPRDEWKTLAPALTSL